MRKREEIQRRRLRDSPLHQRVLLIHHLKHQHGDPIDLIAPLPKQSRCIPCQTPMCSTLCTSLHTFKVRSLYYPHKLRTCRWSKDPIQSPGSSSLFGHSGQKGGENFQEECAQLRGSRAQTQILVHYWRFSIVYVWFKLFLFL